MRTGLERFEIHIEFARRARVAKLRSIAPSQTGLHKPWRIGFTGAEIPSEVLQPNEVEECRHPKSSTVHFPFVENLGLSLSYLRVSPGPTPSSS